MSECERFVMNTDHDADDDVDDDDSGGKKA
jgi:hypothetical protein